MELALPSINMAPCAEVLLLAWSMGRRRSSISPRRTAPSVEMLGYLTTKQAAKQCGASYKAVQEWFDKGLIKGVKTPGGHRKISQASLDAFMNTYRMYASHGGTRTTRILVVDDETVLAEQIKLGLEMMDRFEVRTAENWLKAGLLFGE